MAYTETQRTEWLELAAEVGPGEACSTLGYPARRTATNWFTAAGLDLEETANGRRGRALRTAHDDERLLDQGTRMLERIESILEHGEEVVVGSGQYAEVRKVPVSASSLASLSTTWARVVTMQRLIQGRHTESVQHTVEEMTAEARDRLAVSRKRNAAVLEAVAREVAA